MFRCKAVELYGVKNQGGVHVKNQAYRMALLYDFYGDMLTDRQKEFYDLYYNEDLSLSEIAENYGISRQGVRDVIVRAEATLTELEDKTGIIRRFHVMQDQFSQLDHMVDDIQKLNVERYQDNDLEALCLQMKQALSGMKQE
jgi:hypothetical protein